MGHTADTESHKGASELTRGKLALFNAYSYAYNLLFGVLEICPQFLRRIAFGLLFGKLGRGGLVDYKTYFRYPSKIRIGDNVFINRGCAFYNSSLAGVEIVIGDNVAIGPHVRILTADHDYSTYNLDDVAATVTIGDNAWVGGGSIILPGVTIGEGAVIGAGSVVTKSVEPFTIAAGNPARAIRKREIGVEVERPRMAGAASASEA